MKSCLKIAGLGAALATTASLQAEVALNENLSIDGYVIGSGVVIEGSGNDSLGDNGGAFDASFFGATAKFGALTARASIFSVNPFGSEDEDSVGLLDGYVSYTVGGTTITAGKYLGYLGFESFHSPNNAFISFSQMFYASPWATGAKVDYAGEGFSVGFSARDSQNGPGGEGFFEGDGEFSDDIGYEAYVMLTSVENLTVFLGAGFEDIDGGDSIYCVDLWVNYVLTEKFSVAGEVAVIEDNTNYSWLLQGTYALTEDLSLSGRVTGLDGSGITLDTIAYGTASTYKITENFSVKGEVTYTDPKDAGDGTYAAAIQGLFRF